MVKKVMPEVLLVTTIGRKCLILQLFEVNKLGFVNIQCVIRMRVGCTAPVLRNDIACLLYTSDAADE